MASTAISPVKNATPVLAYERKRSHIPLPAMNNYTAADLIGSICGVLLFLPFTVPPGYVLAWFTNAFGYRQLPAQWRFLIAIPLSVSLSPILAYCLGSKFGWPAVWFSYATLTVLCLALLIGLLGHERPGIWLSNLSQAPSPAYIIAAVWLVVAVLSLVDLQVGNRLYFSVTAYDHSVRAAITDAINRTGVRPENPFYHLGAAFPLRYHYFWFIGCSLVDRMGGGLVDARRAIIASVVWSGWAFACMIPLFLFFVFGFANGRLRRTSVIAIALTIVTGLDIIPTVYYFLKWRVALPEMEWWNDQVTSWWGTGLWVPHHLAALTAGLMGVLLLWHAPSTTVRKTFAAETILAGISFAAMVGTSVYVGVVFAVFTALWMAATWLSGERRYAAAVVLAGAVAIVLTLPYIATLLHATRDTGAAGGTASFIKLTIRDFAPLNGWMEKHHLPFIMKAFLRFLLLPVNYFLELGFFSLIAAVYPYSAWKRRQWNLRHTFATLLAFVSVFMCTFFRSGVIANNDLGDRGFLAAQFIFLLWAADLIASRSLMPVPALAARSLWLRNIALASLIILGALGTIYEIGLLRFNAPLEDARVYPPDFSPDRNLGQRTFAMRTAYDRLQKMIPVSAIIQNNPQWKYPDYFYGLYAHRQTAAYDPSCGAVFGGSLSECKTMYPEVVNLFSDQEKITPVQVADVAKTLNVTAVVVKDLDPSWRNPQSWVWQLQPAIANSFVRIFLFPSGRSL